MKIAHISKRPIPYANDDEGSISHALRELGHEVVDVREQVAFQKLSRQRDYDVTLFHHWYDAGNLAELPGKKVCWYFDLVDFQSVPHSDVQVINRHKGRPGWVKKVAQQCDLMCVTDGDWAAKHPEKTLWLLQGADHRITGRPAMEHHLPILLAGGSLGAHRKEFIRLLENRYPRFRRVKMGYYGLKLRDLIAKTKIVVAPDYPVNDNYWSNRVFITTGFGGFMVHPYCARLAELFKEDEEIVFYRNREELVEKIDYYLEREDERRRIFQNALCRVEREHTYLHRCEKLVEAIEDLDK